MNATGNITIADNTTLGTEHGVHKYVLADLIMMFFLFGVLCGHGLKYLLFLLPQRFQFPESVVLFIVGGLLPIIYTADESLTGQTIAEITNVHPHVILFVFLPPLLFESGFNIDFHVFRKLLWSSILLATVGVVLNSGFIALLMKLLLDWSSNGWSWAECLVAGSILAATDPVAVIAALQSLGAPKKLATIIDGEALLNDGTAYVFFVIFLDIVVKGNLAASEGIRIFVQLAFGGPLWGLLVAFIISNWINSFEVNYLSQILLMVFGYYFVFTVAEEILHVSSVLAVVVYGIYMSSRGKYSFSPGVEHASHYVYNSLAFYANTFIFILAGAVTVHGYKTADPRPGWKAWVSLLILYVSAHIIRGLSMALLFPALRNMGYGLSVKEAVFMTWSGLRGAVGLSLAMIVSTQDNKLHTFEQELHFYVGGIVFLTLVINGFTCNFVYARLNIYQPDKFRETLFCKGMAVLEEHARSYEKGMYEDWFHHATCWNCVDHLVPRLQHSKIRGNELVIEGKTPLHSIKHVFKNLHVRETSKKAFPATGREAAEDNEPSQDRMKEMALEMEANNDWGDAVEDVRGSGDFDPFLSTQAERANPFVTMEHRESMADLLASQQANSSASVAAKVPELSPQKPLKRSRKHHVLHGAWQSDSQIASALFNAVKNHYHEYLEKGKITGVAARLVIEVADNASELWVQNPETTLEDAITFEFESLARAIPEIRDSSSVTGQVRRLKKLKFSVFKLWAFRDVSTTLEALAGYIHVHHDVLEKLFDDLNMFTHRQQVGTRIHDCMRKAQDMIKILTKNYPEFAWMTRASMAARELCLYKVHVLEELAKEGFIDAADSSVVKSVLAHQVHRLERFWALYGLANLNLVAIRNSRDTRLLSETANLAPEEEELDAVTNEPTRTTKIGTRNSLGQVSNKVLLLSMGALEATASQEPLASTRPSTNSAITNSSTVSFGKSALDVALVVMPDNLRLETDAAKGTKKDNADSETATLIANNTRPLDGLESQPDWWL